MASVELGLSFGELVQANIREHKYINTKIGFVTLEDIYDQGLGVCDAKQLGRLTPRFRRKILP